MLSYFRFFSQIEIFEKKIHYCQIVCSQYRRNLSSSPHYMSKIEFLHVHELIWILPHIKCSIDHKYHQRSSMSTSQVNSFLWYLTQSFVNQTQLSCLNIIENRFVVVDDVKLLCEILFLFNWVVNDRHLIRRVSHVRLTQNLSISWILCL